MAQPQHFAAWRKRHVPETLHSRAHQRGSREKPATNLMHPATFSPTSWLEVSHRSVCCQDLLHPEEVLRPFRAYILFEIQLRWYSKIPIPFIGFMADALTY